MENVKDVAQYILERQGEMTTIKLQKLVYYCQAWALVWQDSPLFDSRIEAWANGPVVPDLYSVHQGNYLIGSNNGLGNSDTLSVESKEIIDSVLKTYGSKQAHWLVELTHLEEPWKKARGETPAGVSCNTEITHAAMAEYYSGL